MQSRSRPLAALLCLPILAFAACSGGGGGAPPASPGSPRSGTVQLLLDPATGSDTFVETLVAAASLQLMDGSLTGNLLPASVMMTMSDPTGEPAGLLLRNVPAGSYRALHLLVAPGSGVAVLADGSRAPVDFATADLTIPFAPDVAHDGTSTTWITARHRAGSVLQPQNGRVAWAPGLAGGPAGGAPVANATLRVLSVQGSSVVGSFAGTDDGGVHLEFEHGAELFDDRGNHVAGTATFLGDVGPNSELRVTGSLDDHGGLRGQRVRHCLDDRGGNDGPRLIGRITDLDPAATSFGMDVLAETQHGNRTFLGTPQHVTVTVGSARIHRSDTYLLLAFGDLLVADLVKVRWSQRAGNAVTASEIEVESHSGSPASPEIEGRVSEVRTAANLIVVVPRGNDPLVVNGQGVQRAEIAVTAVTRIERRASGSSGVAIQLGDIVAGQDRIWIRGIASGPTAVDAIWIRVRAD